MRTAKGGDRSVSTSASADPAKAPKSATAVPADHSQICAAYPARACTQRLAPEPPLRRKALRANKRALRRQRRATVKFTIKARDAAGNITGKKRVIRLRY